MIYEDVIEETGKVRCQVTITKDEKPKNMTVRVEISELEPNRGEAVTCEAVEDEPKGINYRPPMVYRRD